MDLCSKEQFYASIPAAEVWGVGRKHAQKLQSLNIHSVLDLACADDAFIRKQFSIVMQRTVLELQAIPCIEIESMPPTKQQIVASRSFGQPITNLEDLQQAIVFYVQDAFKRLREEKQLCGCITVFVQSNPFDKTRPYYSKSASYLFPQPTDNVLEMSKHASKIMTQLYKANIHFKKCGVIMTCLEPKAQHIYDLLTDMHQINKTEQLMQSVEAVQHKFGKKKLAIGASQLKNRTWSTNRNQLSINPFSIKSLMKV